MLLEVGKIDKPHGVRGEVVVSLTTNREERMAEGAEFELRDGRPLLIESARRHQNRWIVRFAGVDTREAAEALHGSVLRAEPLHDPDALWIHELIGSTVVDHADGREIGRVATVEENPASDLLVLGGGELIPLRFVVDRTPGRIVVDVPAGLLEL